MLTSLRRTDPDFFEFDWLPVVASARKANWSYATTTIVRLRRGIGLYAVCSRAGLSGQKEPVWSEVAGTVIRDGGSLQWTMTDPSGVSLPTISAVSYTFTQSGITQSSPTISGNTSQVKFDASAAQLGMYDLVAEATIGGEDFSLSAIIVVVD